MVFPEQARSSVQRMHAVELARFCAHEVRKGRGIQRKATPLILSGLHDSIGSISPFFSFSRMPGTFLRGFPEGALIRLSPFPNLGCMGPRGTPMT